MGYVNGFWIVTINTVFGPALIYTLEQKPKNKKFEKSAKSQISKPKRVKLYTTCLNGKSKSHNIWKNHFTENLTKTLIRYGQKVDFFIRPLNHVEFWTVS